MSKQNDSPAFPTTPDNEPRMNGAGGSGMSLRDYFAASAIKGFCANPGCNPQAQVHFNNLAEDAYRMADAMIAERNKEF